MDQLLIAIIIYVAGLIPAFDYGYRSFGAWIFIFAWLWPAILLWSLVAHAYGGDWNEGLNKQKQRSLKTDE